MSTYRFRECKDCSFHDVEPTICERCKNGSEFLDKYFESGEHERLMQYFDTLDSID